MPAMQEIYERFSVEYDQLVSHEDAEGNLRRWLLEHLDWNNRIVCEAGAGTGRITEWYLHDVKKAYLHDRSSHMLEKLKHKLGGFQEKLIIKESSHLDISIEEKADIFIEGWSFGHLLIEHAENADAIIQSLESMIKKNITPLGTAIIIETMGTNVQTPHPTRTVFARWFEILEQTLGYKRHILRTDYEFKTVDDAARIMGFFFGETMADDIMKKGNRSIVEFTGVWIKQLH